MPDRRALFLESTYDLGFTRSGPRASYEHGGRYVVDRLEPLRLEPIYA